MAFPNNCTPRLIQVDDSCGCTLTRANIRAMTPQDFEDQGFKEVYMDRIIAQTKEARMTGVLQRSLTDLFLSKMVPIRTNNLGQAGKQSIIAPFFMVPQRHNVNANYFLIYSAAATSGAGTGSVPASAWDIQIINEASQFATPLVGLERYFLPGRFITVLNKDTATGVGRTLQFKILNSVDSSPAGFAKATITVEPNYSTAGWAALSGAEKAVYQPTHGLIVPLSNSVSDYESWCYQDPAENTNKLLVYWLQTIRETHCYNDEYLKALNAPLTSNYFKKFRELPLAEQRKRQAYLAERAFYNTVFYGQRISELQTVEGYTSLPQVRDVANPNCTLEYKANTLGIRQQLSDCGRVTDLQGAALNMDVISALAYSIRRNREIDSGSVTSIDIMTDRFTASNILDVMSAYYTSKYGLTNTRFYNPGQALKFEGQVLWNYNSYELPEQGVSLNVITDPFFDDYLDAFPISDKSRGRALWIIDWSDFQIGLAGSSSVTRQTNVADNIYNCVIKPNINHYQLTSKTIAVMMQDPNRHAVIENFADSCPTITVRNCLPYES